MEIIRFPTEIYQPLHISSIRPYLVLFLGIKKAIGKIFFYPRCIDIRPMYIPQYCKLPGILLSHISLWHGKIKVKSKIFWVWVPHEEANIRILEFVFLYPTAHEEIIIIASNYYEDMHTFMPPIATFHFFFLSLKWTLISTSSKSLTHNIKRHYNKGK